MSGWRWVWVAGALEVVGWLKVGFLERRRVQGGMGWVVVEGGWVAVVGWGWGCDWELGLVLGMGWVVGISAGVRGGGRISVHGHRRNSLSRTCSSVQSDEWAQQHLPTRLEERARRRGIHTRR